MSNTDSTKTGWFIFGDAALYTANVSADEGGLYFNDGAALFSGWQDTASARLNGGGVDAAPLPAFTESAFSFTNRDLSFTDSVAPRLLLSQAIAGPPTLESWQKTELDGLLSKETGGRILTIEDLVHYRGCRPISWARR